MVEYRRGVSARRAVVVVSRNPNQLDVFVTGNDGVVYTSAWTQGGAWSGIGNKWWNIGGIFPPGARLAAVAPNPTRLNALITGTDGVIYTSSWTQGGTWTGIGNAWSPLTHAIAFHWDNPFSGQNKYNLFVTTDFQCFRDSGAGNNANVTVTLRPPSLTARAFFPAKTAIAFPITGPTIRLIRCRH